MTTTTLLILAALALIWIGLRDTRQPRTVSFSDQSQRSVTAQERPITE